MGQDGTPRRLLSSACVVFLVAGLAEAKNDEAPTRSTDIQDLEQRLEKVEKATVQHRLRFAGDCRSEADAVTTSVPDHFDGRRCSTCS